MKVAVIGAGVAGTAAAWAARRSGSEVVVIHDRPGASALGSGAADYESWERDAGGHELTADATLLTAELGYATEPGLVATAAGLLRPARAHDAAVLDLSAFAGRRIAVADVVRDDWDAVLIARALSDTKWARQTGTSFEARGLDLDLANQASGYDLAHRFDDPDQAGALAAALKKSRGEADAWLLGPWLGVQLGTAARVRQLAEMPIGETLSPPGGAAGARFEAARDLALSKAEVGVRRGQVREVSVAPRGIEVSLDGDQTLVVDRVVLAIGGVVGGGVELEQIGRRFHLSLAAPVRLQAKGKSIDAASTLHGVDFAFHGVSLIENVGIETDHLAVPGVAGVFAAGDAVADRPRTWLRALESGLAAGRAAGR